MTCTTRRRPPATIILAGTLIAIIFGAALAASIARVNTIDQHTGCTVDEKEDRALAALDKRDPRVYTSCGVFVIADVPLLGHFNSADVYATLQPGHTYTLTTSGWRNGLFSWFPTITEATG